MNKFNNALKVLIAVFFIFTSVSAYASNPKNPENSQEKYSKVKILIKNESDMKKINNTGLFFDHAEVVSGEYTETWLSETEISMLQKSGIPYQITIQDWKNYYDNLPKMSPTEISDAIQSSIDEYNVSHSIYGTMGGFLIFSEVVNKLDSMRLEYPNLISEKWSIGSTVENREMWTVRVSNSPDAPTGRPEVWFHSLIHAREPMSMEQNIYFIYWLLENYNIDPIATYILRNRELYFTPVFNPDGYEYNRSTDPNGGGFWRKNRKLNSGTNYGVDLNRNYGPYAFWNSTNNGSSTDPTSDTYRGVSPFSEPETQNAMNFVNSRNFKGILSYHTYGNYLIRPWGYVDAPSPDENIFQSFSQDMVLDNHFTLGRSNQTVNYGVRGVTDDWYYNDSGHAKAIAFTPEVGTGTDGFWPLQSRILTLAKSTVTQNIYFALANGAYVASEKTTPNKEYYSQGEAGNLKVNYRNKGLLNAQNVKIELTTQSPYLTIQTNSFSYSNINSFASDSLNFNFTVAGNAPVNSSIPAVLKVKQNDTNTIYIQNVNIVVGQGTVILADSAENGTTRWTAVGGWGTTTSQSYSPTRSFTDSPTGNYSNSTTRSLTLATSLNVSSTPVLLLSYWYKHTIDTLDNAYIDVSSDNGATWRSAKYYNKVVSNWTKDVIDITSLAAGSTNLKIRFSMISNGTLTSDGIYIDNIKLTAYNDIPTGINTENEVPQQFNLSQNYPNPFNPNTVISYNVGTSGNVLLKVFNMLGKEVATLVNERQNAGSYSVDFYGSNLSSGMYYYKIESGLYSATKKMMLIK
jgi:carboxypeptidase T